MSVNRRTHRGELSTHRSTRERRTQAQRRSETRRALLDAALAQLDGGISFDLLSLRRVARTAGVVPAAFYRHFAGMDELGLALVEESVQTLRAMLREARADQARRANPDHLIARSVAILVEHVQAHRRHFAFIVRARASGNTVLRHAIRSETRLFASELATDLARFPLLSEWTTSDLQMLAGMFVDSMIATIDAILEASGWGTAPDALTPERRAQITKLAEKQLRLIVLAIPHWNSHP